MRIKPAYFTPALCQLGFTLVELVVGIVVMAVAFTIITTMLVTQSRDSIDPLHQMRAAELAQSVLNEIVGRSYDENSDHNGGVYRCGEQWWQGPALASGSSWYDFTNQQWQLWQVSDTVTDVPCSVTLGKDSGEQRSGGTNNYNDVDDYITASGSFVSAVDFGDATGQPLSDVYRNFDIRIQVSKDFTFGSGNDSAKRIDLTVRTPKGNEIDFSAYRGNY
ncbi:type IV pilus modification PilV family protein [Motilimonas pumila]|uniref:Type II secretion system protein n=1 Tax=Motilimonas pumila TaxID=2303987 RepID=A0A418YID0_9GAMM|nr:prepilin-type N-terminal cleavage/methylation domain-containing protein [Motilimonas pumila]RJG49981.1 type II secretion system protein [Motilimonas pumila]